MNLHHMLRNILLTFLIFSCLNLHAQQGGCNNEIFSAGYSCWQKKGYPVFSFERSVRKQSFILVIGGGYLGTDDQYVSPDELNSTKLRGRVNDSRTIDFETSTLPARSYLERTHTRYTGVLARFGYSYYFGPSYCADRLKGLYTGVELSAIRLY